MAEQSLFGITPEALQASRDAALRQQASQYAQLDPFQRASASIYQGANQLGGAVGGMLGGQDPEMMRIKQRQQLLQGVNPSDAASLIQAAQRANDMGDYGAAQEFAAKARSVQIDTAKLASEQALTNQRNREKLAAGLDEKVFAALAAKATPASVKAAQDAGNDIGLLQVPENVKVSTYGQILKDAGIPEGSPEFQKQMQAFAAAELESTRKGKGTTITNLLPGVKGAGDLVGLRSEINKTAKPFRDAVNAADEAITLADNVLETGNFASAASLARSLAKASGETQLSKQDVAAFGGDPSLVGRVSDLVSGLTKGVPTADTTRKLKSLAILLKKKNEALENNEIKQLQGTARMSGLYTEDQIKNVFTLRGATQGTTRKTAGGVSYTVED